MKFRFTLRTTLFATTAAAIVTATAVVPTHRAWKFRNEFAGKSNTVALDWVPSSVRFDIHDQFRMQGLTAQVASIVRSGTTDQFEQELAARGAMGYSSTIQPLTFDDVVHFRRRLEIRPVGSWVRKLPDGGTVSGDMMPRVKLTASVLQISVDRR